MHEQLYFKSLFFSDRVMTACIVGACLALVHTFLTTDHCSVSQLMKHACRRISVHWFHHDWKLYLLGIILSDLIEVCYSCCVYSLKLDQTAECSYNAATCLKTSITVTLMDPLLLSAGHRALTYIDKKRKARRSRAPGIYRSSLSKLCMIMTVQMLRSEQPRAAVPDRDVLAGVRHHMTHAQIPRDIWHLKIKGV